MNRLKLAGIVLILHSTMAVGAPAVLNPIGMGRDGAEYHVSCSEETECQGAASRICNGHYFAISWSPLNFDFVCEFYKPPKQQAVQVFIRPECKDMFYGPDFINIDSDGKAIKTKKRRKPEYVPWDSARAVPFAYKDPRTSITIFVESDGRRLAAMDGQGKLLWVRNPWEEARFCPYRTQRPVVDSLKIVALNDVVRSKLTFIGANLEHSFIHLRFDSSQFGLLDESTGDFFPEGQD